MLKTPFLIVKDHSVSGEEFKLLHNGAYEMLETFPKPSQENLGKYYKSEDYISHTDNKRNLFERAYHWVKGIAIKRKLRLINSFNLSAKTLLDVGCGTGDFLENAKFEGWEITGIEPNEKARNIANTKTNRAVYDISTMTNLPKAGFNVITLWHVLEHIPKPKEHIKLLKELLSEKGRLVIAVPNHKSFDAQYYKNFWAAYDVPRHLWHFSRKSIELIFQEEGMIVEKVLPMKFDAYYVALLSEKYKSGWMNIFNAFFVASRSNLKASRSGEYSSLIYIIKKT